MYRFIKHIPNFITSLNLVSGSLALTFALDGNLLQAGLFICLAAIFDFLDGFAARWLKAYSETGKQLDSLGDLVSFGLAPASILFMLLEFSLFGKHQPLTEISASWSQWLILISPLIMPIMGALRLARFNAGPDENFFRGLPIPANGLFWASLGLMSDYSVHNQWVDFLYSPTALWLLGLFTSGVMVINLPMFSLKFSSLNLKENWYRYIFLAIALILLAIFHVYGLALTILSYIFLSSIFFWSGVKY